MCPETGGSFTSASDVSRANHIQSEDNVFGLADATPSGYRERGRFRIPDKGYPSWAHPVISDGHLYRRNQDTVLAYDIKVRPAS